MVHSCSNPVNVQKSLVRLNSKSLGDLRYADDTALLSTTTEGLEKLIKAVKEHSEQKGLHLNVKKTKIMDIDKCKKEARIQIEGEEIERVKSFEYLGARIEANGKTTPEIRRRLAMATAKLQKMEKIWKGQDVHTKVRILKSIIFPTATYGCEAWTINKTDSKRITAFELKCYRKILRISWTEKIRNEEVLIKIGTKTPILLQSIKKLKLTYFGHIKRHQTLEKHILEAKMKGKRGKGRPTRRWENDIEEWLETSTSQAGRLTSDRETFRRRVQEATSRNG
ncbi:endonuclease-reverse transcriptase [Plakobranchus ocellatus]|uniref:Endonuclease-reverse transcriptase n=2 Tax=Plakobranchus ocellatus TaxID=259542 RepID=A0AAV4DNA7_9GAST|nr:endonuclease-reverse transcriptase [Plakobranchus ocellatus]